MFRLLFKYKLVYVFLREFVGFRRVFVYYGGIIYVDLIKYIIFNIKDIYSRIRCINCYNLDIKILKYIMIGRYRK